MLTPNSKKVSKEEFDAFVASYPIPLHSNVAHMFEPPVLTLNDFSSGKVWPESAVAWKILNTAMQGHPLYKGEPDEYYLKA